MCRISSDQLDYSLIKSKSSSSESFNNTVVTHSAETAQALAATYRK